MGEAEEEERRQMLCHTLEVGLLHMDIQHILAEKDAQGNTALHYAAINGLESCVKVSYCICPNDSAIPNMKCGVVSGTSEEGQ